MNSTFHYHQLLGIHRNERRPIQSTVTFNRRGSIACMIVFSLAFASTAQSSADDGPITLPTLRNSSSVRVRTIYIEDKNRLDPFTNNTRHRELIISMYYPISATTSGPPLEENPRPTKAPFTSLVAQYMPSGTAAIQDELPAYDGIANGTYERLQTLCQTNVPFSGNKCTYPSWYSRRITPTSVFFTRPCYKKWLAMVS